MLDFFNLVSQTLMLLLLVLDIYVISNFRKYKIERKLRILLVSMFVINLAPFSVMLDMDFQEAYYDTENCFAPYFDVYTLAAAVLTAAVVIKLRNTARNMITVDDIKTGVDNLPIGVLFYEKGGRILLTNHKMNEISRGLTGDNLRRGDTFWSLVLAHNESELEDYVVVRTGGKVYMLKQHPYEQYYECTATDITETYHLNEEIISRNEILKKHNLRLKEYSKNIGNMTREKEILETKIHIHDEMGRMLLLAKRSISEPDNMDIRRETLKEWRKNTALLDNSEDSQTTDLFEEIKDIASTIGVNVIYRGSAPTASNDIRDIFINAIHECITNTASHTDGDELYVEFFSEGASVGMMCSDNGGKSLTEIKEGGGLSSLRNKVEASGGSMTVGSVPRFWLEIKLSSEVQIGK